MDRVVGQSVEWTDVDGQRVVIRDGRLSIYGDPSMRRPNGQVAIGADIPAHISVTVGADHEHTPRGRSV